VARLGGGEAQLLGAGLDAGRIRGAALVHRGRRVAHDDDDLRERDVELLGDDLRHGDVDALALIDLAEERRHPSVGRDGNPGIELGRIEGRLGGAERRGAGRLRVGAADERKRSGGGDDQRAGRLQHLTAREGKRFEPLAGTGAHVFPPVAFRYAMPLGHPAISRRARAPP
jgi:hypothetical protein